jgi:hypothetical protein
MTRKQFRKLPERQRRRVMRDLPPSIYPVKKLRLCLKETRSQENLRLKREVVDRAEYTNNKDFNCAEKSKICKDTNCLGVMKQQLPPHL